MTFLVDDELGDNKQVVVDNLFASLKNEKKKLKDSSLNFDYFRDVMREIEINAFKKKLYAYEGLLANLKTKSFLRSYSLCNYANDFNSELADQDTKKLLLEKVIDRLRDLIVEHNADKLKEFKELENVLDSLGLYSQPLITWLDSFYYAIDSVSAYHKSVDDSIKKIRNFIRYYLQKKYKILGRDIRQCYRDIIRFKFKNLDDQSGDDENLLLQNVSMQVLITLNNNQNEIHKYHRKHKRYTRE